MSADQPAPGNQHHNLDREHSHHIKSSLSSSSHPSLETAILPISVIIPQFCLFWNFIQVESNNEYLSVQGFFTHHSVSELHVVCVSS